MKQVLISVDELQTMYMAILLLLFFAVLGVVVDASKTYAALTTKEQKQKFWKDDMGFGMLMAGCFAIYVAIKYGTLLYQSY